MSSHPVVHIEFSAKDRESAAQFYGDLFGWQTQQMPDYNYATWTAGVGPGGGFNPVSTNNPPGTVLVYIGTDDIPGTLKKAEGLGAAVLVPETEIPDMGWFGIFRDPSGNQVALYKEKMPT
jgi:uncharacterized protein